MTQGVRVSVVGATGLVGRTILSLLESRRFPVGELTLFASNRSAGEEMEFRGDVLRVRELDREVFLERTDVALCSAGREVSAMVREWVAGTGIVAVDNSSAFRMHREVPLVVPEVNGVRVFEHSGYVANPNCTTIQLVMVLKPLLDRFGLERVVVSSYQSVSGAGQKGMEELSSQTISLFNHGDCGDERRVFPRRIAFNLVPQIGCFDSDGYTEEETKVVNETRKILEVPDLEVSCTAVRVPVFACHAESVLVETRGEPGLDEVRSALAAFPGVAVVDDPAGGKYPDNAACVERDEVFVGRIRRDLARPGSFHMWVVADNILKGAALNAVQIAELLGR